MSVRVLLEGNGFQILSRWNIALHYQSAFNQGARRLSGELSRLSFLQNEFVVRGRKVGQLPSAISRQSFETYAFILTTQTVLAPLRARTFLATNDTYCISVKGYSDSKQIFNGSL